jgi:hypothetical protein
MSERHIWIEIRELSEGRQTFSQCPAAETIGALARSMIDLAIDKGYSNKNKVAALKARASAAYVAGVRASARYDGAVIALGPVAPVPQFVVDAYQRERIRIAREFVAIEDALLAARGRGRPNGRGSGDTADFGIILRALRSMVEESGRVEMPVDRRRFNELLRKEIEAANLPHRGDADQRHRHIETHRIRIQRKIPEVVRALGKLLQ